MNTVASRLRRKKRIRRAEQASDLACIKVLVAELWPHQQANVDNTKATVDILARDFVKRWDESPFDIFAEEVGT